MKFTKLILISIALLFITNVSFSEEKTVIVQSAAGDTMKCKIRYGFLQTDCEIINKKVVEKVAKEKTNCDNVKGDTGVSLLRKIKCLRKAKKTGTTTETQEEKEVAETQNECAKIKTDTGVGLIKKIKCLQAKKD